jgi:hypothetical protein
MEDIGIMCGHLVYCKAKWYILFILVYFVVFWYILWSFGIFCGLLVYFVVFWYILWSFGIHMLWSFGIFFLILICCTKKNLATLFQSFLIFQTKFIKDNLSGWKPDHIHDPVGLQKSKVSFVADLGPMLWFLKYFCQKIQRKYWRFCTQNKAKLCKIFIITLVFKKNANFFVENCRKSQKIVIITSTPCKNWNM